MCADRDRDRHASFRSSANRSRMDDGRAFHPTRTGTYHRLIPITSYRYATMYLLMTHRRISAPLFIVSDSQRETLERSLHFSYLVLRHVTSTRNLTNRNLTSKLPILVLQPRDRIFLFSFHSGRVLSFKIVSRKYQTSNNILIILVSTLARP